MQSPRPRPHRIPPVPPGALAFVLLATSASLIAGCGSTTTTDPGEAGENPRLRVEEITRIGSLDDPDYAFTFVPMIDVDHEGRVYALEATEMSIRVYSPEGEFLHRIGRRGEGPGEFGRSGPSFGVVGDTVWAVDWVGRRASIFLRDGTIVGTTRVEPVRAPLHTNVALLYPRVIQDDHTFLSDLGASSGARDEVLAAPDDTVQVPIVRFELDGSVRDTAGFIPRPPRPPSVRLDPIEFDGARHSVPRPEEDLPISRIVRSGRIVIDRERPETGAVHQLRVTKLGFEGDTLWTRTHPYQPVPYDQEAIESIAWASARLPATGFPILNGVPTPPPARPDSGVAFELILEAMDFPAFQTPVTSDRIGKDGSLWLRRELRGGETQRWTILDPEGRMVGGVELPQDQWPTWMSGDRFWLTERDQFDVPFLVQYRLVAG